MGEGVAEDHILSLELDLTRDIRCRNPLELSAHIRKIVENIIFNELIIRECAVDIGIVYSNEKNAKGRLAQIAREIDFIANSGGKKTYI